VCSSLVPLSIPSTKFNTRVIFWSSVERDSTHTYGRTESCGELNLVLGIVRPSGTKLERSSKTPQWSLRGVLRFLDGEYLGSVPDLFHNIVTVSTRGGSVARFTN
jgi:hypothetical protein